MANIDIALSGLVACLPLRKRGMGTVSGSALTAGIFLRIVSVVGAILLLSLGSAPAAAADHQEDLLIKQGIERRRQNDDSGALELFSKAYELHHAPRALAQIGLARMALGLWVQAEADLEAALAMAEDPWIHKNTGILQEALDRVRQQVGSLQVLGSPAGAEVMIGGEVRGTLPMEKAVHLRTGEYKLEVRASGHEAVKRSVQIVAGQLSRETVALAPVHQTDTPAPVALNPPSAAGAPVAPAPVVVVASPTVPPPPPVEQGEPPGARLRTLGLIAGGVGVAAVAAGLVFGLEARADGNANSTAGHVFDAGADSQGRRFQTLQYVGYGVGAALLAAGTTMFVLGSRAAVDDGNGSHDVRVSFAPIPGAGERRGVGGGMALLGARF